MEEFKNTVYVLAVIAITTGILDVLNTSEKLCKYTKYITSLVVILSLLAPFKDLFSNFSYTLNQSNFDRNISVQEALPEIKTSLTSAIEFDLSNKLSIPESVFETEIFLTSKEPDTLIESITITITDIEYNRYSERIEYYLKSNYGCKVNVIQCFKE